MDQLIRNFATIDEWLDAKEKLSAAKTEAETNRLDLLCQTLDRQIGEEVYELYGLTEEEIKIVEGRSGVDEEKKASSGRDLSAAGGRGEVF
jgi:hypothetical protein